MTLERARLVDPLDIRRIPVIGMPDGVRVPVTHASTGVRKVVKLAYMLVWQWTEHVRTRDALGLPPARPTDRPPLGRRGRGAEPAPSA